MCWWQKRQLVNCIHEKANMINLLNNCLDPAECVLFQSAVLISLFWIRCYPKTFTVSPGRRTLPNTRRRAKWEGLTRSSPNQRDSLVLPVAICCTGLCSQEFHNQKTSVTDSTSKRLWLIPKAAEDMHVGPGSSLFQFFLAYTYVSILLMNISLM